MFQKSNINSNELKSESNRLSSNSSGTIDDNACNFNERYSTLASTLRQQSSNGSNFHIQHPHSTTLANNKEENKSHISGISSGTNRPPKFNHNFLPQHSQQSQEMQSTSSNSNNLSNQRTSASHSNMTRSTTNPQLYQVPHHCHTSTATLSSSHPATTSSRPSEQRLQAINQALRERISSIMSVSNHSPHHFLRDSSHNGKLAHNNLRFVQDQQDKDQDEVVTMIREEFENNPDGFRDIDLEAISSIEKDLPVELSFLIRQQAYCMAKMNYLDRQIRELKESARNHHQAVAPQQQHQVSSCSLQHGNHLNNRTPILASNANAITHIKNGNFIPSDDSGGEYSRATMSDDDELSSLLDQIAKSVRPDRNVNQNVSINHQQQLQQRSNYSVISNQPQQYAIINPNQLHHQAVPVFVMGSPIAVAHPASSISSTVLPGVHFQPEPRYNQYYEDFYIQNNSSSSTLHRHSNNNNNNTINTKNSSTNGIRSQQFDSSITTIEQLVSQKEKRQIKSQLKSADNWLKMRSSNLCNLNTTSSSPTNDNFSIKGTNNIGEVVTNSGSGVNERNLPASSSASATLATENSNSVIEDNQSR